MAFMAKPILVRLKDDTCPVVLHPALKDYFTYRLYKTAMRLRADMNAALSEHGVIGVQLGILRVLEVSGPTSQVELGRNLGIDKASMVKLLDGVEDLGFVVREADKKDRRVKWIKVTEKGRRMLKTASKVREGVEKKFLAPLSQAERQTLENLLRKLLP